MSFGSGKIWMNGSLVEWADAKIHIGSHVVHYGSAVFEGARCYDTPRGTACFRLDAHMARLFDSARIYRMEPPQSKSSRRRGPPCPSRSLPICAPHSGAGSILWWAGSSGTFSERHRS